MGAQKKTSPMEYLWIGASLLGFVAAVMRYFSGDKKISISLMLLSILAFAMFLMRRYLRKISKD